MRRAGEPGIGRVTSRPSHVVRFMTHALTNWKFARLYLDMAVGADAVAKTSRFSPFQACFSLSIADLPI